MIIESWEDRSGAGKPGPGSYGYVYFNDGSRVGYSQGLPENLPVWQPRTNGGGQYKEVTWTHFRMAIDLLHKEGVLTDDDIRFLRTGAR